MHFIEPILMPRGTHYGNNYWEVYSSKIKRKVCLFSNLEYENFLTLEMNPLIKHFCEQPLKVDVIIDGEESRTVFDFWVKYQDGFEEMQEVKYSSELTGNDKSSLRTQSQIERQKFWCEQNHINYCIRTEETINKGKFFIRNYNIMAAKVRRYVSSNIDFLQDKIEEILVLEKKITIGELIQREELPENYELSFLSYLYYIGRIYMNIENKPLDFFNGGNSMAEKQLNTSELSIERISWKNVITESLNEQDKDTFYKRKQAVDMYIDGKKLSDIQSITGIARTKVALLVEKCTKILPETGEKYGYTALLPYKRIKNYTRYKDSVGEPYGLNGSFSKLILEYPTLHTFIYNNLFGNKENTLEKNITPTILHRKFINECKKLGMQDYEYPLNTRSKGSVSFRNYIKTLLDMNEKFAIQRENINAIQKFNSTGKGQKHSQNPIAPFNTVQLDGHKIDILYTYEFENKNGELIRNTATRCWLIAVVDVATRVILGYSLTPHENYNQTDVLAAIQDSIVPRVKRIFAIPGFEYPENGGYFSLALPHISWALFDNIMLDNAKAHLAKDVVNKLTEKLKCSVNFGSVATPETRGIIERMFRTLEENGFHRIVSTTGSNILDNKRKNAEQDALRYNVKLEDIEEMTEYFIALYNNSPHKALDNETPLQCMQRRVDEAGMFPFIAERGVKIIIENLTNIIITRVIRGSYKGGKRPYIHYLGVEYRSDIISYSMDMIGEKIQIEINPKDISFVRAYLMDGSELGILNASGEWGLKPHSIKTRKEVMKYARENNDKNTPFIAHISDYEEDLRTRAKLSRRAGTKAAIIKKEQKNTSNPNKSISHETSLILSNNKVTDTNTSFDNRLKANNKHSNNHESYSPDIEELLLSMSIEEAYEKGLL